MGNISDVNFAFKFDFKITGIKAPWLILKQKQEQNHSLPVSLPRQNNELSPWAELYTIFRLQREVTLVCFCTKVGHHDILTTSNYLNMRKNVIKFFYRL